MNIEPIMPWLAAFLSIAAVLGQLKAFFSSGERQLGDRLEKAESKLIDLDRRTQSIEGEMKHLPDRETSHNLELALAKISGRLDTLDERLKPIAATSGRLQEFLLEQAQK